APVVETASDIGRKVGADPSTTIGSGWARVSGTASESGTGHITTGDRGGGVTDLLPVLGTVVLVALGRHRYAQRVRQVGQELPNTSHLAEPTPRRTKISAFMLTWSTHPFLGRLEPLTPRRP